MFQIFIVLRAKIKDNVFPLKYSSDRFYNREDQGRQLKKMVSRRGRQEHIERHQRSPVEGEITHEVNCITKENVRYRIYDK